MATSAYTITPHRSACRISTTSEDANLQADLLDGWAVLREWGRIGSPGQVSADKHEELS
jgi:hypothetical protein